MALSTPGVGSGLDIAGIVDKLMAIEQAPLSKINTKLVGLQAQVSAYGSLKSAVSSFRDVEVEVSAPIYSCVSWGIS